MNKAQYLSLKGLYSDTTDRSKTDKLHDLFGQLILINMYKCWCNMVMTV